MRITQQEMQGITGGQPLDIFQSNNVLPEQEIKQPGVFSRVVQDIPQDIGQTISGIGRHIQTGADVASESAMRDAGTFTRARGVLGGFGQATARSAGEVFMGLIRLPFTQEFEEKTAEKVGETVAGVAQRRFKEGVPGVGGKTAEELAGEFSEWKEGLPEDRQWLVDDTLRFVETGLELTALRGGGRVTARGARATKEGIETAGTRVADQARRRVQQSQESLARRVGNIDEMRVKFMGEGSVVNKLDDVFVATGDTPSQFLTDGIKRSVVDKSSPVSKRLQHMGARDGTDADTILKQFSENAYAVPEVTRAGKVSYEKNAKLIREAQNKLANDEMLPLVRSIKETFSPDDIINDTIEMVRQRGTTGNVSRMEDEVRRIIQDAVKREGIPQGGTFNAEQLHRIQIDMNKSTRTYNQRGQATRPEWEIDTEEFLARTVRSKFNDVSPELTNLNQRYGQMTRDLEIMGLVGNRTISVDAFGQSLGRMVALMGVGSVGIGIGGAGSLAFAGIIATIGANSAIKMIRNRRFPADLRQQIMNSAKQEPMVRDLLLKQTRGANRTFVEKEFGDTQQPTSFKQGATPSSGTPMKDIPAELQPLAREARKYKSAEEFVKAQPKLFHGGRKGITELKDAKGRGGVWVTKNKEMAEKHARFIGFETKGKEAGSITEVVVAPKKVYKITDPMDADIIEAPGAFSKDIAKIKKQGYDAIESIDGEQLFIFDPKKTFTKSQLTDIWKQANIK